MTDIPTSLAKFQGPDSNTTKYERQAKALFHAGGAILLKHQMEALSPAARAEVIALMEKAFGKRKTD
jgi:hypothetical protein